ncbi:MAG: RagB/SusD family nutrient uptake outer membrane protein [Alistipes sp.]|nr:RagB/SusD family nutrient uptake outer membrane protein [Alistipes sp.]
MKKIYLKLACLAAASLILWTGCENFLETESKSTFTEDVVFSSTTYTDFAIVGIYTTMIQWEVYTIWYNSWNTDIENMQFDLNSYNDGERRSIGNYLATPGQGGSVSTPWSTLYKAIERANLVVKGIENSPLLESGSEEERKLMLQYLGEARTLRAYLYYDVVRNWGDVPFKLEPTEPDGSNIYAGKTDRDEILDTLIEELLDVEDLVPWLGENSNATRIERVTKGFVKGMIARIALARGGYSFRKSMQMERGSNWEYYYGIARDQCADIIANGTHQLNPNYTDIWKNLCAWRYDSQYNEPLIELGYTVNESGEAGYIVGWRFDTSDTYGYGNMGSIYTNPAHLYSYDPSDSRLYVSVALAKYNSDGIQEINNDATSLTVGKWNRKWMPDTYIDMMRNATSKIVSGVNWVPIRMADVYLMYAETINELGGDMSLARQALKTVRGRAFNGADDATYTRIVDNYVDNLAAGSEFFNAIVQERAWEFLGESVRKWDLIRWNLLTDKIQEMRENNAKAVRAEYPYDNVPRYLFVQYDPSDPEEIDYEELNLHQDWGTANIDGYTRIQWYPTTYRDGADAADDYADYLRYLNYYGCGLDGGNGQHPAFVQDRHLLPIAQTVISDSAGYLENDYGYEN